MTDKELLIPIWDTEIMYDETSIMVKDKDGKIETSLLYEAEEIISVTSYNKTVTYQEGKDWFFEDGKIKLTPDSAIPYFTEDELILKESVPEHSFPIPGGYIYYAEGIFFTSKQIAVTYKCKNGQWKGVKPEYAEKLLPRTFEMFKNGTPCRVILFGDSISMGANSSYNISQYPFIPNFATMLFERLSEHYGKHISCFNTSMGGKGIDWAMETIDKNVNDYNPDLVIFGFGMNDFFTPPAEYEQRVRDFINNVRSKNPDCEFILIATSLPNPILTDPKYPVWGTQKDFYPAFKNIEADTKGVAVADITNVHHYLLTKKHFSDLTSNNINHPNDFFYRIHAQYLCGMLIEG